MNKSVFLLLLIILGLTLPLIFNFSNILEGYSNNSLEKSAGEFPNAQTNILLQDTYPPIGKNQLSNNSANDIWMDYPVFQLGSYDQTTNNLRYPKNPDEGTCMPASMCGALYHDKNIGDNYISPLPPVSDNGTRVGYFTAA
jgi:hypothetical protein